MKCIKDPAPLNTTSTHNDTTPKLTKTPDHTPHPHPTLLLFLIHFPTMKTLYTYTLIAITPHNSTLHNTTLHTNFLLQDRQLQAVERSRIS